MLKRYLKTVFTTVTYLTGAVFLFFLSKLRRLMGLKEEGSAESRHGKLVVISGCDSGLGLAMAKWAADRGYRVLAGCLQGHGEGAGVLRDIDNVIVEQLDVTDKNSIARFSERCRRIVEADTLDLYSLILNAAISIPGEFFWLTEGQAKSQMDVNFWGAVNMAEAFQSQLLEHKSRLIVVGSDCADYPLPGFGIYSASKSALQTWATSLRLEVAKYGVTVVTFQPGSFPLQSRLIFGLTKHFAAMKAKLEQKNLAEFYGSTLEHFSNHFASLFSDGTPPLAPLDNDCLKKALVSLLEDDMSKTPVYIYETAGQAILHMMISTLPRCISDALILKVLNSPKWKSNGNKIK